MTILLLYCGGMPSLSAQGRMFHKLTVEDGLSQNSVLCFGQDKQGYMWIGTSSGLNRYNSHSFQIFKYQSDQPASISGNNIACLLIDHLNRVWAGTTNGLNIYDRKTGTFIHFQREAGLKNGLGSKVIRTLFEDQQHQLWVGTQKGLYVYRENKIAAFEEIIFKQDGINVLGGDIRAVMEDSGGDIWVGTGENIIRISKNFQDRVIKTYKIHSPLHSLEDRICTTIEKDNHTIWIGTTGSGVWRFNPEKDQFEEWANASSSQLRLPHDNVRKIRSSKDGKLWIGTQQGLCEYDMKTGKMIVHQHDPGNKYSLSQNSIYDVFTDRAGNLWTGTYYGGISISYSKNTWFEIEQATGKKTGLTSNLISHINIEPDKGIWIGSDASGITFKDGHTGAYHQYRYNVQDPRSLGSNLVKSIFKDREGQIWVATHGGGLNQLNKDRKGFTRYKKIEGDPHSLSSNDIMSIVEDEEGILWLATENNGLNRFDKKTKQIIRYHQDSIGTHKLPSLFLRLLLLDQMGNLWIASEGGLFYKKKGDSIIKQYVQIFKEGKKIPGNEPIRTLFEDSRKQLWIGTASKGLFQINPSLQQLENYTTENGLPSNNIKGITEDLLGNLWITTDNGLCKFERQQKTFVSFNIYDGLPGNDFNANSFFRDQNGRIFVGSFNGLIHFDPTRIEKNNELQQISFHALKIGNEYITPQKRPDVLTTEVNLENDIHLKHKDNIFTVEFSLLNFIKPKKNQYLYRLNGFENDWISNSTGAVTYTNLPSGTYTLEVKAANNDGVWNPNITSLKIVVHPPFWATWWAYAIYLILTAAIAYGIIRFFWIREKFKQDKQLQQYKIDFFTNISHEIRTQLTLIATPLEAMAQNELPDNMRKGQLEIMQKHTKRLTNLVSELLDFRKAETGAMPLKTEETKFWPMLLEIADEFEPIAIEKGITLHRSSKEEGIQVKIDRQQMSKVISNLINNGLKFTERGGKVGIELKAKGNLAILRIWDTGIGIDPKYFRNLFANFFQVNDDRQQNTGYGIGLALAKSIVELHGGTIDVSSKVKMQGHDGFTVFTVKLPLVVTQSSAPPIAITTTDTSKREKPLLLVVEDHEDLRRFIADALSTDHEIMEASDGAEGIKMALDYIPDLIISDIMMPVTDGLTLCSTLKKDKQTSHIPIILLTAKSTVDDQIKGLEFSADAYMIKPFDLRLLRTQVSNLLQNRTKLQEAYRAHYLSADIVTPPKELTPDPFLQKMVEIIEAHMEDSEFTISDLTRKMAMSQPVLYKKLKALTDLSVNDFIKSLRMKKAAELIQTKNYSIAEVAYMVGFSDRKYFSKEFKKYYGTTPSEYGD